MKKVFLNESEKRKIISEREKMIIESFSKTFNKIKRVDEDELNQKENVDFDEVFNKILSITPEYEYKETSAGPLIGRYKKRSASNGITTAIFYYEELAVQLRISILNNWDEGLDRYLRMSYEFLEGFDYIDNEELGYQLKEPLVGYFVKFNNKELVNTDIFTYGNLDIDLIKNKNLINVEFMNLLSEKTKEKLYYRIDVLIEENYENQSPDDY